MHNPDSLRIISKNCVQCTWTVSWLNKKGLDSCKCKSGGKILIEIKRNGLEPQTVNVNRKEYIFHSGLRRS